MMQHGLFLPFQMDHLEDSFIDTVCVADVVCVSSSLSGQNGYADSGDKYLNANFKVKRHSDANDPFFAASSLPKRIHKPQRLRRFNC